MKSESNKLKQAYMDCKFLKSPMAGDISPPRFKLDRFLQKQNKALKVNSIYESTQNSFPPKLKPDTSTVRYEKRPLQLYTNIKTLNFRESWLLKQEAISGNLFIIQCSPKLKKVFCSCTCINNVIEFYWKYLEQKERELESYRVSTVRVKLSQ